MGLPRHWIWPAGGQWTAAGSVDVRALGSTGGHELNTTRKRLRVNSKGINDAQCQSVLSQDVIVHECAPKFARSLFEDYMGELYHVHYILDPVHVSASTDYHDQIASIYYIV